MLSCVGFHKNFQNSFIMLPSPNKDKSRQKLFANIPQPTQKTFTKPMLE
ncbi:MAG: hypothetical protein HVN35_02100 [Methanobacteriaceae archaeon]|nr:hypothetical protein [Methanobacteriaceae archaeon]